MFRPMPANQQRQHQRQVAGNHKSRAEEVENRSVVIGPSKERLHRFRRRRVETQNPSAHSRKTVPKFPDWPLFGLPEMSKCLDATLISRRDPPFPSPCSRSAASSPG